MLSVHGISVTGGSFPAQIWHLYMESALDKVRPFDFLEPKHLPVYKPFVRGDYAIAGGYYPTTTTDSTSTSTDTTVEAVTTTEAATTEAATTTAEAPPVITDTLPAVTEPASTDTTYTDTVATG
jgi:hypothetical protein